MAFLCVSESIVVLEKRHVISAALPQSSDLEISAWIPVPKVLDICFVHGVSQGLAGVFPER
jgi:hypothetical protein